MPRGEIWAEGTGGDGTPLILVADWSTSGILSPVLGLLADRYRLIWYDDRGFGRSPAPGTSFTRLADLRAVIDRTLARPSRTRPVTAASARYERPP